MTTSSDRAILAGGCFWGMQHLIRRYPGVVSTRVGYTGGDVPNATYRNHGTHAEAIEIIFDPSRISYRKILEFFFQSTIRPRGTAKAMTSGQATGQQSSTAVTNRSRLRRTLSPM
jgi:methionine-S-sulfoxide reductase